MRPDETRTTRSPRRSRDPAAAGVRLVAQEHFDIKDISVAAQLTRIKGGDPQALIAWTSGTQFGTVLRNIVDAGITVPIVTSSANLSHTQLDQYRSFSPKLYFCAGGGVAIQAERGRCARRSACVLQDV